MHLHRCKYNRFATLAVVAPQLTLFSVDNCSAHLPCLNDLAKCLLKVCTTRRTVRVPKVKVYHFWPFWTDWPHFRYAGFTPSMSFSAIWIHRSVFNKLWRQQLVRLPWGRVSSTSEDFFPFSPNSFVWGPWTGLAFSSRLWFKVFIVNNKLGVLVNASSKNLANSVWSAATTSCHL